MFICFEESFEKNLRGSFPHRSQEIAKVQMNWESISYPIGHQIGTLCTL